MPKIFLYIISILLNVPPLFSGLVAQNSNKSILLSLEKSKDKNLITVSLPKPVKIWGQKENLITDSILYEYPVIDKGLYKSIPQAINLPTALNILVEEKSGMRTISLLKRYNSFLDKEWSVSYRSDSLIQNFENKEFYQSVPFVKVNFPIYKSNKVEIEEMEFCFLPYEKNISYDDPMVQNLPLYVSPTKKRETSYVNCRLVYKKDAEIDSSISIFVSEKGNFHKDRYEKNINYKHSYNIGDTVYLSGSYYRLEGVSPDWKYAYIVPLGKEVMNEKYLSGASFSKIKPYLPNDKEYTIIDFWGTWCAPCIAKLPDMKDLYNQAHLKYNFLGICVDSPDNFKKAEEIYLNNQIPWSQIMDSTDEPQTISFSLHINAFPTYMIIENKTGKIIYSNGGEDGFKGLKELVLK